MKFFYRHIEAGGDLHRVDEVLLVYRYRTDSITWSTPKELLREIRVHWLQRQVLQLPHWSRFAIWSAGRDGRAFFRSLAPDVQARVEYFLDVSPKLIGTTYNYHGDGATGSSHEPLDEAQREERKQQKKAMRRAMQGVKQKPVAPVAALATTVAATAADVRIDNGVVADASECAASATVCGDAGQKRTFAQVTDHRTVRAIPIVHFSECKLPFISCVSLDRGGEFEANLAALTSATSFVAGKDYFFFC